MTKAGSVTHPNGVKFTHIVPYQLVKSCFGGYVKIREKDAKEGVLIEYPDGVKIFRPNEYYDV